MKKIVLFLIISINIFALGGKNPQKFSVIPKEQKSLINKIISELDISLDSDFAKVRKKIYSYIGFSLGTRWFALWNSNTTADDSRFKNSSVRFVDMTIVNKRYSVNFIFIYFREVNQIYLTSFENHIGSYDDVLKEYKKIKSKEEEKYNTENSALLKKKDYMKTTTFLLENNGGFIQYKDSYTFDTK